MVDCNIEGFGGEIAAGAAVIDGEGDGGGAAGVVDGLESERAG